MLAYTEDGHAHGDLGEELVRYAREAGLPVVAMGAGHFAALVAVTRLGLVVACARGMQHLGVRAGLEPPAGVRLPHEPAAQLGAGWWWVRPWCPDVSKPDGEAELRVWFAAAAAAVP